MTTTSYTPPYATDVHRLLKAGASKREVAEAAGGFVAPRPDGAPALGTKVRLERSRPPRGSWTSFAGALGRAVAYDNGAETAVALDSGRVAWVLVDEWVEA